MTEADVCEQLSKGEHKGEMDGIRTRDFLIASLTQLPLSRVYTRQHVARQYVDGNKQHVACISATCIPLYSATDGQQTGNNFVAGNMLLVAGNMLLQAALHHHATRFVCSL